MSDHPVQTVTVRRYPGLGWKVLIDGEWVGNESGPWWPNRKAALKGALKFTAAAASVSPVQETQQ